MNPIAQETNWRFWNECGMTPLGGQTIRFRTDDYNYWAERFEPIEDEL